MRPLDMKIISGAACGNAVAGRGYFGVPVPAQPPNGLSEL
jgi:hypothetical protein